MGEVVVLAAAIVAAGVLVLVGIERYRGMVQRQFGLQDIRAVQNMEYARRSAEDHSRTLEIQAAIYGIEVARAQARRNPDPAPAEQPNPNSIPATTPAP